MPSDIPAVLPVRHAVAVALRRADGLTFAVQRPDEPGEELPGIWGLPAVTLRDGETPEQGVRRLGAEKLSVELTPLRQLAEGEQTRDDYVLHMTVYEASPHGEPVLPPRTDKATSTLYVDADWLSAKAFQAAADKGSLCCQLFLALSPGPSPASGRGEAYKGPSDRLGHSKEQKRWMVDAARRQRETPTRSEAILWERLQRKALDGHKFRRQHPIGRFILDFYCPEKRLAVEVDGAIHASQKGADEERQEQLEAAGLNVVRVSADEVEHDIEAALSKIRQALNS